MEKNKKYKSLYIHIKITTEALASIEEQISLKHVFQRCKKIKRVSASLHGNENNEELHLHIISHVKSNNKCKNTSTTILRMLFPGISDEKLNVFIKNYVQKSMQDGWSICQMVLQPSDYILVSSSFCHHVTWKDSRYAEAYSSLKDKNKKSVSCDSFIFETATETDNIVKKGKKEIIMGLGFGAVTLSSTKKKTIF